MKSNLSGQTPSSGGNGPVVLSGFRIRDRLKWDFESDTENFTNIVADTVDFLSGNENKYCLMSIVH